MPHKEYKRNCVKCGKEMFYVSLDSMNHCKSGKCNYCANVIRGNSSNRKGCHHTNESKKLISLSKMGVGQSLETKKKRSIIRKNLYKNPEEVEKLAKKVKAAMRRPDVRKRHLDALHKSQWIKVKTDVGQLRLLEKWNKLGFNFEPNYQIHTDSDLFYIDGYDKDKNVVFEYDSSYHNQFGQKKKDLVRQRKIVDILHPKKFWRFDSASKKFQNILEE